MSSTPVILAIHTATFPALIVLGNGDQVTAALTIDAPSSIAEELIPAIARVLDTGGRRLTDVDRLSVTVGPGRFTGIRLGLSAMQGLSLALDRPATGISTFDAIRHSVDVTQQAPRPLLTVADGGREFFHGKWFFSPGPSKEPVRFGSLGDLMSMTDETPRVVAGAKADLPDDIHTELGEGSIVSHAPTFQGLLSASLEKNDDQGYGLTALYLRHAAITMP